MSKYLMYDFLKKKNIEIPDKIKAMAIETASHNPAGIIYSLLLVHKLSDFEVAKKTIQKSILKFVEEYVFSVVPLLENMQTSDSARRQLWCMVAGVLKLEERKEVQEGWMVRHLLAHLIELDNSDPKHSQTIQRRANWELSRPSEDFPVVTLGLTSPSFFHTLILAHVKPTGELNCSGDRLYKLANKPKLFHNDVKTSKLLETMARPAHPAQGPAQKHF